MPVKDVLLVWLVFFGTFILYELITVLLGRAVRKLVKKKFKKELGKTTPYVPYRVREQAREKRSA